MMAFRYHFQHCSHTCGLYQAMFICDSMPFPMFPTWLWTIDRSGTIVLGYTFVTSWHPMWCPQFPSTFASIEHKRWWKMQLYRVSRRSLGEFVSTKTSLTTQLIGGASKYVFKISQNSNLLEFCVHRKHSFFAEASAISSRPRVSQSNLSCETARLRCAYRWMQAGF